MSYQKDVQKLRSLEESEVKERSEELIKSCPLDEWHRTMPASIDPKLVLIGVSPGGSPDKSTADKEFLSKPSARKTGKSNFYYKDGRNYWTKLRYLVNNYFDEIVDELDSLSLTSHFNLGTEQSGRGTKEKVEEDLTRWISGLLNNKHNPDLVVLFGLKNILQDPEISNYWNHEDGLTINWQRPHLQMLFKSCDERRYHFRVWETTNSQGHSMKVVLWPNHPSKHPFTYDMDMWESSVDQFIQSRWL